MVFSIPKKLIFQIICYGIIGVISASIDTVWFFSLSKHLNLYVANIISVNIGIMTSFFLNTYITFKKRSDLLKRCFSFFFIGYCGLFLSMFIMWIGVSRLGLEEVKVKIFSVFVVAVLQFVLNKIITFKS